ncbi:MAG: hypothetical protein VYA51_12995 [Planctomycetota bacterium]|nr:hypothetical protein [Planctomycetota bacterium]
MAKPSFPKSFSSWEIAGVSALPLVEMLFALDVPGMLHISPEQMISILAALMTVMAIVRASLDAKKAKQD